MTRQYVVERAENRVQTRVTALLVGRQGKLVAEIGLTENVSSREARVIMKSERRRNDTILLALPGFRFTSAARVAYCDALGDGQFGTGLEFTGPTDDLEMTALATALEFPRA